MNDAPRGRRTDILDVAWRLGLLARLKKSGGEYVGGCPKCGGRDRFAINATKGLWNCRGCATGGDAIDLVRHVTDASFASAVELVDGSPSTGFQPPPRQPPPPPLTTTDDAIRIWRASVDPPGTVVERYLASRELTLDDEVAGSVIRWNPAAQWRDDWRPKAAMVCLMRSIANGEPQAVSLTFLAGDAKTGRIFIGPVKGAAVMLDPFDAVTADLRVGEGTETAMTACQYGLRPTWALGTAGAIAALPLLGGVTTLSILREHDEANRRDADRCALRWHSAGREVFDVWPKNGKDLNDAIRVWGAS